MKNSISRRGFVKTAATGFAGLVVVPSLGFPSSTIGAEDSPSMLETGDLFTSKFTSIVDIDGVIGSRLRANLENWELTAYRANPGMVEMFYDRDRTTPSDSISQESKLNPWSGEFVGKYLCASIRSYQILHDPRQKELIDEVVDQLLKSQGEDGYMGPFDRENRLTGPNTWDIWGHYWVLSALLLYSGVFNAEEALDAARKSADMLVEKYLNSGLHMTNDNLGGACNYAVIHAFTQLYMATGESSYLEMAKWIEKEWELPESNLNFVSRALKGEEMYKFGHPGNRWESLHNFLGIHDLYLITGDPQYYDAFVNLWQGIRKNDIHNTGGFTTGEAAIGDPYGPGAIETCCTVAWIDMSTTMLKLTANPLVADELELATYNGLLGGQHPSGRWWTYNTPMDGRREASADTIVFQARAGSPELNCCSVNGPRGLSLLTQWALLSSEDGIALNFYGQSQFEVQTPGKQSLQIRQITDYPCSGKILVKINLKKPESFALKLRIPSWSSQTKVKVNNKPVPEVTEGSYLTLSQSWKKDDMVEIELDMSPHYWSGDGAVNGSASLYYGPLLLAFDVAINDVDPAQIPEIFAKDIQLTPIRPERSIAPWVLFSVATDNGKEIKLMDFATAGAYGNKYVTWLPISGIEKKPSDPSHPLWINRNLST